MQDKPYKVWRIPKRKGGFRVIESPCDELKKKQKAMVKNLKGVFKVSPFAHGFSHYKNIATCAMGHVGKRWVASEDISDFFPSITWEKFEKFFNANSSKLYKEGGINVPRKDLKEVCFHDFVDGKGLRLPQGAPTSPLLSNVYLFRLDWFMAWKSHEFGCDYSRYADDLIVSGESKKHIVGLLKIAARVLEKDYGLQINGRKTKIVHRSRRQLVCGVVVNEKLSLPRKHRKNLRAEVFQLTQKGLELSGETRGRLAFHAMVRENTKTSCSSREIIDQIILAKKLTGV